MQLAILYMKKKTKLPEMPNNPYSAPPPKWPIFGIAKPIIDLKTTANQFTFQVDEHAQMTSLEARIARCARQNLQNGQIIFFHFGPETPPFCPKWAHFRTFTNQS